MDKIMARANMKFGIGLFAMLLGLLVAAVIWAFIYLSVVK